MSRDNTILIIRLRVKKRRIWVVAHVQAHEMFGDPQWTRWWLWAHPVKYTKKWSKALLIAFTMAKYIQNLEHGIIKFNSKASIDDCILRHGEIEIPHKVAPPSQWFDNSIESDWKSIAYPMTTK